MNPTARLSIGQWAVLFALFAIGFALSFAWWKTNPNAAYVLEQHPEWNFHGFVIYDGYGNYAEAIHALLVSPGAESRAAFVEFTDGYIHSIRPLYPLLVALLNVLLDHVLMSAFLVNIGTVLLCLWAFHFLARRVADGDGNALFHLHLLFLGHLAVIGMLARPMADPLSLALLFFCMEFFMRFVEYRRPRDLVVLLALGLLAVLAKTVFVLAVIAFPLALLSFERTFWRAQWRKVLFGALAIAGFAGLSLFALWALPATEAAWRFALAFFGGLRAFPTGGPLLIAFVGAAFLFLALALQVHPVFALRNPGLFGLLARVQLCWMAIYVLQRFLFFGFSLDHSRARYGLPIVAGAMLLSYPGMRRVLGERWTPVVVYGLVAANVAVFTATLWRVQ